MAEPSLAYVKSEFAVTLGYIRQDITWLLDRDSGLNYTIGLLIGCGCEMLAACEGDQKRLGERVCAEPLPAGDWQLLADRLYSALRDGLAHGFDTKHLFVDGKEHQIFLSSRGRDGLELVRDGHRVGLLLAFVQSRKHYAQKSTNLRRPLRMIPKRGNGSLPPSKGQPFSTLRKRTHGVGGETFGNR